MVARNFGPFAEIERDEGRSIVGVQIEGVRFVREDVAATTARGAEIRHGLERAQAVAAARLSGVLLGLGMASGVWALAIVLASALAALN